MERVCLTNVCLGEYYVSCGESLHRVGVTEVEVHVIVTSKSNLPRKTDPKGKRLTKQALSRCVAMAESFCFAPSEKRLKLFRRRAKFPRIIVQCSLLTLSSSRHLLNDGEAMGKNIYGGSPGCFRLLFLL
jgi:hypothetical protein